MKPVFKYRSILFALFFSLVISPLAPAASLGVWPINPRIDAPASSALVWVKNNNQSDAVILQARVLRWRQVDNQDQLDPQDDIVVSPPMIEVKQNAQQIFRIMNRQGVIKNIDEEKSYRLLIDEVPKEGANEGSVLRFQMRYSLPLFVGIPDRYANQSATVQIKAMEAALRYRVVQKPTPLLEIINKSPFHARLSNLVIRNDNPNDAGTIIAKGLAGYILPQSIKQWPLDKDQLAALLQKNINIKFEQEHQELTIVPEK